MASLPDSAEAGEAGFACSVVVPAYNRAHLIPRTIESILAQTCPAGEVILVDDGSREDIAAMAAPFGDRVRTVRQENRGPPAARNTGARLASLPWLAFCDSDDLWRPDHLAAVARLVAARPSIDYVFGNFVHVVDDRWERYTKFDGATADFWPQEREEPYPGALIINAPLYQAILRYQPIFPSAVAMRRDAFWATGGFDERLGRILSEDLEFSLRCAMRTPIGVLTEATVGIRKHAENYSGNDLRTALGEIEVLRFALSHHHIPARWRDTLTDEVRRRSVRAIDTAFATGAFATLRELAANAKGTKFCARHRLKAAIARLPESLSRPLSRLLVTRTD